MLHTWSSDNRFFERASEPVVDANGNPVLDDQGNPVDTPAPARPPAGYTVLVRDAADGSSLPNLILDSGGWWTYSLDKDATIVAVQFSADGGASWDAPLWSNQSLQVMANSGDIAAQALAAAQAASTRVDNLSAEIDSSVAGVARITTPTHPNGLTGTVNLTAAEVGARGTGPVPVNEVSGLALIATEPKVKNLTDYVAPIPLVKLGVPTGAAQLDASGNVLNGNGDVVSGGGTGSGVPDGGTAGQTLVKNTATNGDVSWKTLTAGDVKARPADTKVPAADVSGLSTIAGSGKLSDATGRAAYDQLPPGSEISVYYDGTAWPARPTARTDITVNWKALTATDPAPTDYITGVDFLWKPAA